MSESTYVRMRQVLASPATQQINFMCQGVWVNPALFRRVLSVLGSTDPAHSVSVLVNPQLVGSGAAAEYSQRRNVFHFRDEAFNTPADESYIVHESVHCGFDIDRRADWRWWGQEACAMIAELRYALNRGMPESNVSSSDTIRSAALPIAITRWVREPITIMMGCNSMHNYPRGSERSTSGVRWFEYPV